MNKLTTYAKMFEDVILHHTSAWELTTHDLRVIKTCIDMMYILDQSTYSNTFDDFNKQHDFVFADGSVLSVRFEPHWGIRCEVIC